MTFDPNIKKLYWTDRIYSHTCTFFVWSELDVIKPNLYVIWQNFVPIYMYTSLTMYMYMIYKVTSITFTSRGPLWSCSYGSWIYNYLWLCNHYLSPLKLWVWIPLMARCTRYHIVIKFVSDLRQVCGFLWVPRFPPHYNWNIVERGVEHHIPFTSIRMLK